MVICFVLLGLGVVASVFFMVDKVRQYTFRSIIFKTVASLFFVALAIAAICLNNSNNIQYELLILFGLVAGLLGDILLGFKYTTNHKKLFIMLGLVAFAIGHVLYVVGLFTNFFVYEDNLPFALPIILGFAFSAAFVILARFFHRDYGKLKFPIFLYVGILFSMAASPLYLIIQTRNEVLPLILFIPAGISFAISDVMLSGSYFGTGEPKSPAYQVVYSVFYYIAQFLIAFSLYFLL